MKKILSIFLVGILFFGLTGCNEKVSVENSSKGSVNTEKEVSKNKGDNEKLVDMLNNIVLELYNETKEKDSDFSIALYNISDKMVENKIKNYTFIALCDKEFIERPNITGYTTPSEKWISDAKYIENYDGKCNYNTWAFTEYNNMKDYNVLVLDLDNNYYSVKVTFKKIKVKDKDRYYPTFSDSKLLK